MDHKYIEEVDLVDRYLMNRLAADESAEFEAHFVDCPECVYHLNTTRALIAGLKAVAIEQTAERARIGESSPEDTGEQSSSRWRPFTRSKWPLALAASVILLTLFLAALAFNEVRRSRAEAERARNLAAEWQRKYEDQAGSAASEEAASVTASSGPSESKAESNAGDLTGNREVRPPAELAENRTANDLASAPGGSGKPRINVAILFLNSTRGADPSAAADRFEIPRSPADFLVSLSLEGESGYADYRMTLTDSRGRRMWESSGLKPDSRNLLTVEFNSSMFSSGHYTILVSGAGKDNRESIIGKYPLPVVKK